MTKTSKKVKLNVRVGKKKVKKKTIDERVIGSEEFIEGFEEKVDNYVEKYVEKVERTKRLTLITGVGFFMLLILFFYAYSFKVEITKLANSNTETGIKVDISELKDNIKSIVEDYNEVKTVISEEINSEITSSESNIKKTPESLGFPEAESKSLPEEDAITELKKKLLEEQVEE